MLRALRLAAFSLLAVLAAGCTTPPAVQEKPGENRRDIFRTITVVVIGVCLYFLLAASIRIAGDWIYHALNAGGRTPPLLPDWSQGTVPEPLTFLGIPVGTHLPVVKPHIGASDDEILLCGMALGYADTQAPVNAFHTPREAVEGFTRWLG